MKIKYETGDVVLIRRDLIANKFYANNCKETQDICCTENMARYRGQFAVITNIGKEADSYWYNLNIDGGTQDWSDGMFVNLNGTFGNTTNGDIFVIVDNRLIFQNGYVSSLSDRYPLPVLDISTIERIVDGCGSFKGYECCRDRKLFNPTSCDYLQILYEKKLPKYTYADLKEKIGHDFDVRFAMDDLAKILKETLNNNI